MSRNGDAYEEIVKSRVRVSRRESHLASPISLLRVDAATAEITASSRATGFFWEAAGLWHLVTNIHALTGWDPQTGRSISSKAFCPTHVAFQVAVNVEHSTDSGKFTLQRKGYRTALDQNGEPTWFEHPELGDQVDVAVLPLFVIPNADSLQDIGAISMITEPVNRYSDWTAFEAAAADDAYVLGFPKGMNGGRGFPIWKRASIASEPDIDLDDLPKILIDTATREGMSGSPVIAVRRGIIMPSGKFDDDTVIGEASNFLGIYSGRIGDDPLGVQLGIVWKARVVEEILKASKRGIWPWDRSPGQTNA